jgi:hypothetical protein
MDALGFALENYNAIGGWRTTDGKFLVDASGTLPGNRSFDGPAELKAVLASQPEPFRRCLAEKLLTYALGRGMEYDDKCAVDKIVTTMKEHGDRFSSLVLAVVASDPFQLCGTKGDDR